jgi:hypothetical protein
MPNECENIRILLLKHGQKRMSVGHSMNRRRLLDLDADLPERLLYPGTTGLGDVEEESIGW